MDAPMGAVNTLVSISFFIVLVWMVTLYFRHKACPNARTKSERKAAEKLKFGRWCYLLCVVDSVGELAEIILLCYVLTKLLLYLVSNL